MSVLYRFVYGLTVVGSWEGRSEDVIIDDDDGGVVAEMPCNRE